MAVGRIKRAVQSGCKCHARQKWTAKRDNLPGLTGFVSTACTTLRISVWTERNFSSRLSSESQTWAALAPLAGENQAKSLSRVELTEFSHKVESSSLTTGRAGSHQNNVS